MADEKRENRRPQRRQEVDDGLIKKLIEVNRVSKTVKGGKNMRFAALVVVGDGAGKIGVGTGKAKEVPEAIEKATLRAKKNMISVSVVDATIPHQAYDARCGRYRCYRRRSCPCGYGSSRNQEHQNEISRHAKPRQLRKSGCCGLDGVEDRGGICGASRQERGRDSRLMDGGTEKWQRLKLRS